MKKSDDVPSVYGQRKEKIELLAPAADSSVMRACMNAGADAVYMGLSRFSARAYALNESMEGYVRAIDYAHLHGKKLYLTFNTLMKDAEIETSAEELIAPLYEAGLDAVIVQDIGVMAFLTRRFPHLPIHVSTQATVMGPLGASVFRDLNVTRIVLPRELSLPEIKAFTDAGYETEVFVHGALCYCYSGQCLFSSIAGGRSGNRGECAQPCRMEYRFRDDNGRTLSRKNEPYLLSMKDLSTLRILPKIAATGTSSLKIEGRMKKAEYAAGVTSIYRKYIDKIENGEEYIVDPRDEEMLFKLFNRNGFTEGYFEEKNGRDMISLKEKEMRVQDEELVSSIRKRYIDEDERVPISGRYCFKAGERGSLTVSGGSVSVTVYTDAVMSEARTNAAVKDDVTAHLKKLGDTGFIWSSLDGMIEGSIFLPVSVLNKLRRSAIEAYRGAFLEPFRRTREATS